MNKIYVLIDQHGFLIHALETLEMAQQFRKTLFETGNFDVLGITEVPYSAKLQVIK